MIRYLCREVDFALPANVGGPTTTEYQTFTDPVEFEKWMLRTDKVVSQWVVRECLGVEVTKDDN